MQTPISWQVTELQQKIWKRDGSIISLLSLLQKSVLLIQKICTKEFEKLRNITECKYIRSCGVMRMDNTLLTVKSEEDQKKMTTE